MSLNDPNHLHPLTTLWSNKSHTSIATASDAATFHSAQGHAHTSSITSHMELHSIDLTTPPPNPHSPTPQQKPPPTSPKIESIRMDRQDSGYSDSTPTATNTNSQTSSRRTSSSSTRRSKTTRPSTKRAARSTPNTSYTQGRNSTGSRRPSMQTRHTGGVGYGYATIHPPTYPPSLHNPHHQFFQFPLLADTGSNVAGLEDRGEAERDGEIDRESERPPPPPATVQYWTSDSTRRLEYAAIDAASRGVRGFFIRLVPDCMLPVERRRTRFCERDGEGDADKDSDAGSVRRYRLVLPEEEKEGCGGGDVVERGRVRRGSAEGLGSKRPGTGGGGGGLLRRWTTGLGFGKRI